MYCSNCGAKLADGAKFCHECGKPVTISDSDKTDNKSDNQSITAANNQTSSPHIIVQRLHHEKSQTHVCYITVDGGNQRRISDGSSESFALSPGLHVVSVTRWGEEIKKTEVYLTPGESRVLKFSLEGIQPKSETYAPKPEVTKGPTCPECGGDVNFQTVTESSGLGCGSFIGVILFALLACILSPILGLVVFVIGLILVVKGSNETVTYAVCQKCGHRVRR